MQKTQDMIAKATLRPGQNGTKHLVEKYGDRLLCVRYRYDPKTKKRFTTVELIEAEAAWIEERPVSTANRSNETRRLGVRIEFTETDLREKAKHLGAIWRPRQKLWEMSYEDVVALGLEHRVNILEDAGCL